MYDAREIANFILDYADSQSLAITNLTLIKVIYFAHGWKLAIDDSPLIKDRIEAWKYGPVIPSIYEQFKLHKNSPITSRATKVDRIHQKIIIASYDITERDSCIIRRIFNFYSHIPAMVLSDMTHEPGSPWHSIWKSTHNEHATGISISNDSIRMYFRTLKQKRLAS